MLIYRTGLEMQGVAAEPEEDSRYSLSAILITPDGKVAATNGHQFLRINAAVDEPDLFTVAELDEKPGDRLDEAVIIPADVAKAFLAASKRKKGESPQQIVVAANDGAITLATADGKTKRRFVIDPTTDGQFPEIDRTIPTGKPVAKIALGVDELSLLLTTLRRCGARSFSLAYHSPLSPLRVTATGYGEGNREMALDGCLMPLREREEEKPADNQQSDYVDTSTGELLNKLAAGA